MTNERDIDLYPINEHDMLGQVLADLIWAQGVARGISRKPLSHAHQLLDTKVDQIIDNMKRAGVVADRQD